MPAESPAGDPRTDDVALGMLLAAAHIHSRQALNEGLRPVGIETRHFGVLTVLDRHGPIIQRRLGDLLELDKSAVVRILDELERLGLATRTRTAHDRRAFEVALTPEGRRKLDTANQTASVVSDRLFGWLRPAEREKFVALLQEVVEHS